MYNKQEWSLSKIVSRIVSNIWLFSIFIVSFSLLSIKSFKRKATGTTTSATTIQPMRTMVETIQNTAQNHGMLVCTRPLLTASTLQPTQNPSEAGPTRWASLPKTEPNAMTVPFVIKRSFWQSALRPFATRLSCLKMRTTRLCLQFLSLWKNAASAHPMVEKGRTRRRNPFHTWQYTRERNTTSERLQKVQGGV